MRRLALLACAISVLGAVAACSSRRSGAGADSGPTAAADSAPAAPRPDGGVQPGRDSGPITSRDAGPACTPIATQVITMTYCAPSTLDCILNGDVISTCTAADPSPNCASCVGNNLVACSIEMGGCQAQWDTYSCCVQGACPSPPTSACVTSAQQGPCSASVADFRTCSGTVTPDDCIDAIMACF